MRWRCLRGSTGLAALGRMAPGRRFRFRPTGQWPRSRMRRPQAVLQMRQRAVPQMRPRQAPPMRQPLMRPRAGRPRTHPEPAPQTKTARRRAPSVWAIDARNAPVTTIAQAGQVPLFALPAVCASLAPRAPSSATGFSHRPATPAASGRTTEAPAPTSATVAPARVRAHPTPSSALVPSRRPATRPEHGKTPGTRVLGVTHVRRQREPVLRTRGRVVERRRARLTRREMPT